jgi:hypothetical protein
VNIYDKRPDPTYGTGAIVNVAKASPMLKASGQWNILEITLKARNLALGSMESAPPMVRQ